MPAQYAIAYAPSINGGQPPNTSKTGSFLIGNMNTRAWNMVVPQTSSASNTLYYASPLTTSAYILALPNRSQSISPVSPVTDQPEFFYSMIGGVASLTDGGFIATANYCLKSYDINGVPVGYSGSGAAANPAGCASVATCQAAFTTAGWFQNYGFIVPA
jgi:hypothetical protein